MPATARLAITILAVADVRRSVAFYVAAFGWSVAADAAPAYAELELPGGARIGLYVRGGFARTAGAAPADVPAGCVGPAEIYLRVEDLDGAIAALVAAGARPLSPRAPREWGDEAAYFADPDGHVVAVSMPPPEDR